MCVILRVLEEAERRGGMLPYGEAGCPDICGSKPYEHPHRLLGADWERSVGCLAWLEGRTRLLQVGRGESSKSKKI
jgi:hypothetical protein